MENQSDLKEFNLGRVRIDKSERKIRSNFLNVQLKSF